MTDTESRDDDLARAITEMGERGRKLLEQAKAETGVEHVHLETAIEEGTAEELKVRPSPAWTEPIEPNWQREVRLLQARNKRQAVTLRDMRRKERAILAILRCQVDDDTYDAVMRVLARMPSEDDEVVEEPF